MEQTGATEEPTAESLQIELHELEEAIREKERVLLNKRREIGDCTLSYEASEAALHEAEKALTTAQEEFRAAEFEHATILPQYERCKQNTDPHKKAEDYKKEIAAAEVKMREAEKRIGELKFRLQEVSATYKNERERRMLMITRVTTLVEELRSAVEHKIALTLPIDEAEGAPDARACLQMLAELTRERETAISLWSRQGREIAAIVEMKRHRAIELKLESERNIALLRATKDAEVKQMVDKFEAERAAIIKDIENMKATNERQLQALRKTKLMSDKGAVISAEKKNPIGVNPTLTPGKRELATATEKVLSDKATDLGREKDSLVESIRCLTAERQRLISATRDLRNQIQEEEQKFSANISNLENQIQTEKNKAAALERENKKLRDSCAALAATLRSGFVTSNSS